jgi:hypothetical protein
VRDSALYLRVANPTARLTQDGLANFALRVSLTDRFCADQELLTDKHGPSMQATPALSRMSLGSGFVGRVGLEAHTQCDDTEDSHRREECVGCEYLRLGSLVASA